MTDSQNQNPEDLIVTQDNEENVDDGKTLPDSKYYYDDSTGYEIYNDPGESEEQDDSSEDTDS